MRVNPNNHRRPRQPIHTSHEARLLGYEKAMKREDCRGGWYDTSAHICGSRRTRKIDEAHVEVMRIRNPIGMKVWPSRDRTTSSV